MPPPFLSVQADTKLPPWNAIYADLTAAGVDSLSPEDAFDMSELGKAVVIDVRPKQDHEQAHPKGAVNVPAFLIIESPSSPGEWGKWIACKANGVVPTKVNPELAATIAAAAADGKAAILACEAGGTLEPSVNFPQGKVSRSLKAVVTSKVLPAERVKHLDGGVFRWFAAGLPMVGEYDASNAGKTPNTAEKPSGRFIDGSE
ncbi:hypothetical protein CHLNCDRAFT_144920 [Chlorella variabilis]|uniref:Rhodanese domain-containing protein n=1 Tax=Chlorella variabilis TaxID=554065 RepID=E1ZDA8_CHLVA|nr:hypothetical protein CHLNCDRAFT_144920 [Chlorella variabilis]EFN56190.1 hypothetical protein CHLNCDRAFT_144920 [Chlorella variabilis]|eukprot:XP_005848292.1 hypothetical protein CHLNCDRAFT_144920 [Chlorella variabilis]